jgi:Ribbon-helix-helix protein, copG family
MKTLTVRLPDHLVDQIEAESQTRKISKSQIIREHLYHARLGRRGSELLDGIADLIGSVHGLPSDLSSRKKKYLKATRYGQKHRS